MELIATGIFLYGFYLYAKAPKDKRLIVRLWDAFTGTLLLGFIASAYTLFSMGFIAGLTGSY